MAVSIAASVLFGVISFIGGHLDGFTPEETTAWRVVFILLALLAVHIPQRQRAAFRAVAGRIVRSPRLIAIVLLNSANMAVQLWVFMWGPANGHGQDVAFGYFLLPLVMVVVGRFFFRDRLGALRWWAVAAAAVGVLAQLIVSGGLSWPVLVIAGLYPVYFGLRRAMDLDSIQVFLIEMIVLAVPTLVVIAASRAAAVETVPETTRLLLFMAVISGAAMTFYILASQLLPLSLFGLLSYLEPVLLLVAALLLGETLGLADVFVYAPIVTALVLLGLSGRRRRGHLEEPPL